MISAIKGDAAVRDREGLPLMDWHKQARADVLRITCPIETRMLASGQHNATSRLVRDCTVAEVLELVYSDKFSGDSKDDLHMRIKRALECSGVNAKGEKPVCFLPTYIYIFTTSFLIVGNHTAMDSTQLDGSAWWGKMC